MRHLPAPPTGPASRRRPSRTVLSRVRMILGWVVMAAVFVAAGFAVQANWRGVSNALGSFDPLHVIGAGVIVTVGITCSALGWHALLDSLGTPVPLRRAAPVYFGGMLGKYIPGSVWAYVLQIEMARRAGIRRAQTLATTLATVAVVATVGLAIGTLTVPQLSQQEHFRAYLWLFLFVPVLVIPMVPAVFNRLMSFALGLLRVTPPEQGLRFGPLLRAAGWAALSYGLFGLQLWMLLPPSRATAATLLLCIGSMGLAMITSLVFFILPAGLGAREAVIVAVLAPTVGTGEALAAALVSRLLFTLGDLALAGGTLGVGAVVRRAAGRGGSGDEAPADPMLADRVPADATPVDPMPADTAPTDPIADRSEASAREGA